MKKTLNITEVTKYILMPFIALAFLTSSSLLVDPTRPPTYQSNSSTNHHISTLKLTAIFSFSNKKSAIINGRSYRLGERVGEYIITNISPDRVELKGSKDNKETLFLAPKIKWEVRDGK